jgi:prepilin-type N-terminal cleavage/methylation domain-containing protein
MVRSVPRARCGFGLIEVTVALVLVAVAALSIAASGAFAQRLLRRAELEEEGERAGELLLDSLAAYHATAGGVRIDSRIRVEWTSSASFVLADVAARDTVIGFRIQLRADLVPTLDTLPCPSC